MTREVDCHSDLCTQEYHKAHPLPAGGDQPTTFGSFSCHFTKPC